jgi:N-acyl-D-aspartate/D-glutamate deacylase
MVDRFDVVIKNGLIVDGSGDPGYKGSLVVRDGRITTILLGEAEESGIG